MELRPLGNTGLHVSALGLGAGQLGDPDLAEGDAEALLCGAVDLGITLIDTARSYGLSEARIGRHLGVRRDRVVLSTKVGYGVEGVPDWTPACVRLGIDAALRRLRTSWIDVVHLHSCPAGVLRDDGILAALAEAVAAGKIRAAAYSGDNEDALAAVGCGHFAVLQTSVSLCDQRSLDGAIPAAAGAGLGVIAKRPLANAPWRHQVHPTGQECEAYWVRWRELALDPGPLSWHALALRFTLGVPGVSAAIVGTSRLAHLAQSVSVAAQGPLDPAVHAAVRDRFGARGRTWRGIV